MIKSKKPHPGRFKQGNPGRPLGATGCELMSILRKYKDRRNEFTLSLLQRLDSIGDSLVSKAIDMALDGNEKMLTLLLERCMNHNLINRMDKPLVSRTVADIDDSQQRIVEKMGEGDIYIVYGVNLIKALSQKRDTINVRELEDQVNLIVSSNVDS